MNAHDLFPDKEERTEVRLWLDLFGGQITRVVRFDDFKQMIHFMKTGEILDENGEILYRNNLAVDIY